MLLKIIMNRYFQAFKFCRLTIPAQRLNLFLNAVNMSFITYVHYLTTKQEKYYG